MRLRWDDVAVTLILTFVVLVAWFYWKGTV